MLTLNPPQQPLWDSLTRLSGWSDILSGVLALVGVLLAVAVLVDVFLGKRLGETAKNRWLAASAIVGLILAVGAVGQYFLNRRISALQEGENSRQQKQLEDARRDAKEAKKFLEPRRLNAAQLQELVSALKGLQPERITLMFAANDRDGEALAFQVSAALNKAGWPTFRNAHMGAQFRPGVFVRVKDGAKPPALAQALMAGLTAAGLAPQGVADNKAEDAVVVVIGPKPAPAPESAPGTGGLVLAPS